MKGLDQPLSSLHVPSLQDVSSVLAWAGLWNISYVKCMMRVSEGPKKLSTAGKCNLAHKPSSQSYPALPGPARKRSRVEDESLAPAAAQPLDSSHEEKGADVVWKVPSLNMERGLFFWQDVWCACCLGGGAVWVIGGEGVATGVS